MTTSKHLLYAHRLDFLSQHLLHACNHELAFRLGTQVRVPGSRCAIRAEVEEAIWHLVHQAPEICFWLGIHYLIPCDTIAADDFEATAKVTGKSLAWSRQMDSRSTHQMNPVAQMIASHLCSIPSLVRIPSSVTRSMPVGIH